MGRNVTANLGHRLDEEGIITLCEALNRGELRQVNLMAGVLEGQGGVWKRIPGDTGEPVEIDSPGGMSFTFFEKVCYVHLLIRWNTFILNKEMQEQVRRGVYDLASYLQASYAIYVSDNEDPESAVLDVLYDDPRRDLDETREWLRSRFGEPQKHIADLVRQAGEHRVYKGYYIDTFQILK